LREERLVSKSISNLEDTSFSIQNSPRNLSASSLQLSPSIPLPDYQKEKSLRSEDKSKEIFGAMPLDLEAVKIIL
jgi:hypothetical protein